MIPRRIFFLGLVVALVAVPCKAACANVIAPSVLFWPGVLPLTLLLAIPATILAAFVERPFVSLVGVRRQALRHSLRANLLSLIVGYLFIPVSYLMLFSIVGLLVPIISVALSILIEGTYYHWATAHEGHVLKWRYLIVGNILSSILLASISMIAVPLEQSYRWLPRVLQSYHPAIVWVAVVGSLAAIVYAIGIPRWRSAEEPARTLPTGRS